MLTCYAVDDEPSAIEILKDYIGFKSDLLLLKTFTNPLDAFAYITKNKAVDIIFLDVEMPSMSGIELAKLTRHKTNKIVFVTAYSSYAYDAFELETDFLLKPYSFNKFNNLVTRFIDTALHANKSTIESFLIKEPGNRTKKHIIKFKDVIYMESLLRHTKIQTVKGEIISDQSFAKTKQQIAEDERFLQVHRSFIVSVNYINVIGSNNLILEHGYVIPVGRNYRTSYLKSIKKN
ncbi:LytTR family DNA-binding domain-containing protein [Pedobacter aquatilis]|uniref:LytR/AlgR family response regulator transcription factor n=1 Tax=Pedobacter aquatilis TaxID=351343 RepID=UPI00292EB3D0|nr:LytTR family DNA-binding domain-containing protein [Pedobacter aquatilis]